MTGRTARGLLDACHPLPSATVTVVVATLALAAGRSPSGAALVAAAVLAGQLSVGWCNDARDADRDRRAGRTDKPVVRGDVSARLLWVLAPIALAASILLSYAAAGPIGGTAHAVAVLSAWAYDLRLKTTVLSPLPYAVSFGLVPAFVTYGLTPPTAPAPWLTAAAALLGVGAHLANAAPDVESDLRVGAGGLVARIGPRAAAVAALVSVGAAVGLLLGHVGLGAAATSAIALGVVVAAGAVLARGTGRALFRLVLVLAVLAVGLLLAGAGTLTA
jgi:4-hydroxybenzoate polyprenyltransferase